MLLLPNKSYLAEDRKIGLSNTTTTVDAEPLEVSTMVSLVRFEATHA